jgi:hypothetical protein
MNRTVILAELVDDYSRAPFVWGKSDSMLMVADAVARLTGVDHASPFRGRYRSCSGGRRLLGTSPLSFVSDRFEEIHPSRACDGDIGALKQGKDWVFGIFIGAQLYMQTISGMGILPRGAAAKAFRIP